jgi:Uma2 family endonuclease
MVELRLTNDLTTGAIPTSWTKHQIISLKIATALLLYAERGNRGQVLHAPCDVVLSRGYTVRPDIAYVATHRTGLIGEQSLRGAPDLIIEILSRDTREQDIKIKRSLYSRFEVKEYWIVDPDSEMVEVLVWSEMGYATAGIYRKSDRLSSPALPKLKLPLQKVFGNRI